MVKVLFVCTGNICRSPTAEGVFRHHVAAAGLDGDIVIDSAGTGSWHVGDPPDPRSQATALERGIDLSGQRARQVTPDDFAQFNYVIALDQSHMDGMSRLCPAEYSSRLTLLLSYAPALGVRDVPDPYYGGARGFDDVFDMIDSACRELLARIQTHDLNGDGR